MNTGKGNKILIMYVISHVYHILFFSSVLMIQFSLFTFFFLGSITHHIIQTIEQQLQELKTNSFLYFGAKLSTNAVSHPLQHSLDSVQ